MIAQVGKMLVILVLYNDLLLSALFYLSDASSSNQGIGVMVFERPRKFL